MQTVVSAEEMRWCDSTAIEQYGIPGLLLMENAGRSVAEEADRSFGPLIQQKVLVFCGKGNNGGDGFVVARHLLNKGAEVSVVLMVAPRGLKGDAKRNFEILKRIQKKNRSSLSIQQFSEGLLRQLVNPHLIIDAIFGTGFSGAVRKPFAAAMRWINQSGAPVIAVDIPSGVNGTSGVVENVAVHAMSTVTLGLIKSGLICHQGRDQSGLIKRIDIGIPSVVSNDKRLKTKLVEAKDVRAVLPSRPSTAHKYSVGKIFVLAGSKGFTGAAALCASAALRAGAGAVILGTPESVYAVLARKLNETIVLPLPATPDGTLSLQGEEKIVDKLSWADVVVIGPGLSQQEETQKLIQSLIRNAKGNLVLDADGLNAIAMLGTRTLKKSNASVILTPHTGELSRLIGSSSADIERTRIESARKASKSLRATVVLKGAPTATAAEGGEVYLNSTGNPGMATVGSGDVLSGIIASFWAQRMQKEAAAYSAVYTHGFAGDLAAKALGERSIVAQDLVDFLPQAFQTIERTLTP